ncbi:MAG: hypothetical protein WC405_17925 [Syntrophales bacterium]
MELSAICSKYNVQIDPQKGDPILKQDLPVLADISVLLEMVALTKGMSLDENKLVASKALLELAKQDVQERNPFLRTIKVVEKTISNINEVLPQLPAGHEKKVLLEKEKSYLEEFIREYETRLGRFNILKGQLSAEHYSAIAGENPTEQLTRSLSQLSFRLNANTRLTLGIGQQGWVDNVSSQQINDYMKANCQQIQPINGPVGNRPQIKQTPTPTKKDPNKFNYRLIGGAGYLSGDNGGVLGLAGASAQYKLSAAADLQVDYRGHLVTTSNTREGSDDARGTLRINRESLQLFVQAGYYNYYNAAPERNVEARNPSQIGLINSGRIISYLSNKIAITLTESIFYGSLDSNSQLRAVAEPGVSLRFGPIRPFIGGIVGYDKISEASMLGGYAGLGFLSGDHDGAARFDYTKVASLLQARYFMNGTTFGVGPALFVQNDYQTETIKAGGSLVGRIKLGNFYIYPSVGGEQVHNNDGKGTAVTGAVVIGFGALRPAGLPFMPYSNEPLPEAK